MSPVDEQNENAHDSTQIVGQSNGILLLWLLCPGILYLVNKLLLWQREQIVPADAAPFLFGVLAVSWVIFSFSWLIWIVAVREKVWMKAWIVLALSGICYAAIQLNYKASIGSLGDVSFP